MAKLAPPGEISGRVSEERVPLTQDGVRGNIEVILQKG